MDFYFNLFHETLTSHLSDWRRDSFPGCNIVKYTKVIKDDFLKFYQSIKTFTIFLQIVLMGEIWCWCCAEQTREKPSREKPSRVSQRKTSNNIVNGEISDKFNHLQTEREGRGAISIFHYMRENRTDFSRTDNGYQGMN